jgi:hypothetical protein
VPPSGCAARQPVTRAAVQNKTESGSTVITVAPSASNGVTVMTKNNMNATLPPVSRAMSRSTSTDITPAMTGEKKRTPNSLSPQRCVPSHCV